MNEYDKGNKQAEQRMYQSMFKGLADQEPQLRFDSLTDPDRTKDLPRSERARLNAMRRDFDRSREPLV